MPRTGLKQRPKRSGGGWKVAVVVVVVLLAGAAVGAWFWNRAAAADVAEEYVGMDVAAIYEGTFDADRLRGILCERDAAALNWTQEETEQISAWMSAVAQQLQDNAGEHGMTLERTIDVDEVSAGLSKAKVYVTVTTDFGQRDVSETRKVHLVREGLAWKVDEQRSRGIGEGASGVRAPAGGPTSSP